MKPLILIFYCLLISLHAPLFAASQINTLNVEGDIVLFSTLGGKAEPTLDCISTANKDLWSVSLKHQSGRALYAALVAAFSGKNLVDVNSANDCLEVSGIESAIGIQLSSSNSDGTATQQPNRSVLDRVIEIKHDGLMSFKGSSPSTTFFFGESFLSPQGVWRAIGYNTRQNMINFSGTGGWLTSILTPNCMGHLEAAIKIEIIVDGNSRIIELTRQHKKEMRWFIGELETPIIANNERALPIISLPEKVVSTGKGVRFESSLEVWLTSNCTSRPGSSAYQSAGVGYVLGGVEY